MYIKIKYENSIKYFITLIAYVCGVDNTYTGADKLFGLLVNEPFIISEKDYFELLKLSRLGSLKKAGDEQDTADKTNEQSAENNKKRTFFDIIKENLDTTFKDSKKFRIFYSNFYWFKKAKIF